MRFRGLLVAVLLTASAWAGIVDEVRIALDQNNFSAAEAALNAYRGQQGINPEYLEAYSWLGRQALEQRDYDRAAAYAKQTKTLALEQLKQRKLDAEPHLPVAVGAAYEVESQTMAAKGQRTQAVALLRAAIVKYANTSIEARLRKNLNVLSLEGKTAPALKADRYLGATMAFPTSGRDRLPCCSSGRIGVETARARHPSSRACGLSLPPPASRSSAQRGSTDTRRKSNTLRPAMNCNTSKPCVAVSTPACSICQSR
jgi:hypothetical protein